MTLFSSSAEAVFGNVRRSNCCRRLEGGMPLLSKEVKDGWSFRCNSIIGVVAGVVGGVFNGECSGENKDKAARSMAVGGGRG